jgi:hypothetical protein
MATKVTVALEDDLDGGPADETMRFGVGGMQYEIDLNRKNARAFRKQLAPFVEHAVRLGGDSAVLRTESARPRSGDIRAWAKTRASRSATAGASRPAWWSSTKPRPADPDTSSYTGGRPWPDGLQA